jgi:predicted peptidase
LKRKFSKVENKETSVAWAEPKWQEDHPCLVLSPTIADSDYNRYTTRKPIYGAIHQKIGQMIKQGMIDSKRGYVMGNSFGGLAVTEYLRDYPDDAAGAWLVAEERLAIVRLS